MTWTSIHVFYTGSLTPMLVDCVAPLVSRLRERGLIRRYFFIRYWLEGPHLRLRLLPAPGADPVELRRLANTAITDYLRDRPALYEPYYPGADEDYRNLGAAEYGASWWAQHYGPQGTMPFRPTNSVHFIDYEPEYARYGGPDGLALAEWHFEHSSDLVLRLSGATNVHVRPVLLGLAAQLCLAMGLAFLGSADAVAVFLARYGAFWESSYGSPNSQARYDDGFARVAEPLRRRVAAIRDGAPEDCPGLDDAWVRHCRELRERVDALVHDGRLALDGATGVEAVHMLLLSSYLHMTNNRLGLAISDEIYLSYLVRRALAAADEQQQNE